MKHLNITLRHLRTFIIVARQGSFNQAAKELSRTQPAITLAIKQLESFIGIKLLERTTRRVSPTAEGENFIPVAERLVRDFDTAIFDLRASAERRAGHVSMAVLPSVATNLLPSIIKTFATQYPGIHLHLDDDSSRGVQQRVERNEVDFGLGSLLSPNPELTFTPLFTDQLQLVCHRDHELAETSGPIAWEQLNQATFLDSGITQALKNRQDVATSRFDFPNITTLIAMLKANLGVSILPSLAMPLNDDSLVSRPLLPTETRHIGLLCRRGWTLSPAAEAMRETITDETPKHLERLGLSAVID